jgi:hypothetical protein
MEQNSKSRLKAVLLFVGGLGIIVFNFYLRFSSGSFYPVSLLIAGIMVSMGAVSILKPGFLDGPTTEKEKTTNNIVGLIGMVGGGLLWVVLSR